MASEPKNMRDVVIVLRMFGTGALRELIALEEFLEEIVERGRALADLAILLDAAITALQSIADESPRAASNIAAVRDRSAAVNFVANQMLGTSLALRNYVGRWHIRHSTGGFRGDLN